MSYPRERVLIRRGASSRVVDPTVERLVDEAWSAQLAEATARGLRLADAPAYRLESVADRDGVLELTLALEPYRLHSALKTLHRDPRIRREHHDRALVADGLVRTADDHYLLLCTPKVTGTELQLVGGTASPAQRVLDTAGDLFGFMTQRIVRALGVAEADVDVRGVLGAVEQEIGCVNLVFDVRLAVVADAVPARDGSEVVVVGAGDLAGFLAGGPAYLPSVASLL